MSEKKISGKKKDLLSTVNITGQEENTVPPWEKDLESFDIKNDQDFKCFVSFFIESTPVYYGIMEMLNEEALEGKRWEIKVISMDYIRNTVLDHCTKSREKRPFNLLCDQILRYAGYEFKGRIPPDLLGYFIKYEIRKLRTMYKEYLDYQREYEFDRKEKLKIARQLEKYDDEIISDVHEPTTSFKSARATTISSKLKMSKSPIPASQVTYGKRRPDSELIQRGEDVRGKFYVKDYPVQGPNVYLAITTIYEQLPAELVEKIGVPVICVIKVGTDQEKCIEENDTHYYKKVLELNEVYYKKKSYRKKFSVEQAHNDKTKEVGNFWLHFNKKIQKPENAAFYGRTILGRYVPSIEKVDFESPDWQKKFKKELYDDLTQALYNLYQIVELYNKHNSEGNINIKIPQEATGDFDIRKYNEVLQKIEIKNINVPLILDAMICQVEESIRNLKSEGSEEAIAPTKVESQSFREESETETDKVESQNHRKSFLRKKLEGLNENYDLFRTKLEKNESKNITLKVITDKLNQKTKINCSHKHSKCLKESQNILTTTYKKQFDKIVISEDLKKNYQGHLNALQRALGTRQNKTYCEILLVLKTMQNNYELYEHGNSQIPDLIKSESIEDIIERHFQEDPEVWRKISSYINVEELGPNALLKLLFDAKLSYSTSERVYIPLLDSYLYTFYNCSKNKQRSVTMDTPLGLKDFFKYVLPKEGEWANGVLDTIREECDPKFYLTKLGTLENSRTEQIQSPVEITPKITLDESIFMFGIKDNKNSKIQSVIDYINEIEYKDTFISKRKRESTKKVQSNIALDQESAMPTTPSKMLKSEDKQQKEIYDFGEAQIIQFVSRDIEAIFKENSKIRIKYRHKHYGRKTMTLELDVCGHRLSYTSNIHINEEQSKFLLIHRSGIILNFKEYKRQKTEIKDMLNANSLLSLTQENKPRQENCRGKTPFPTYLLLGFYILTVKCPFDYIIEFKSIEENNYIKHFYLKYPPTKTLVNELFRINLTNSVLKFLKNDDLEILFASGKKIITKWTTHLDEDIIQNVTPLEDFIMIHGCGKVEIFKKGEEKMEKQIKIEETTFYCDNILIEHENGTTIKINHDGTQIVQFSDGTKFTTKLTWADLKAHTNETPTDPTEDYIIVFLTIIIEHDQFATVIYNDRNNVKEIKISTDITVWFYPNHTYKIKLSEGSILKIKEDCLIFDKYFKELLFQRSILVPTILKYKHIPNPPLIHFLTQDIYGNELTIDTQSQIHYKYSLSNEHSFCLKYALNNIRHFLIRRDLSGFELHPNHRLTALKKKYAKKNDLLMENNWTPPFLKSTLLFRNQDKLKIFHLQEERVLYPSTYGTSYLHPFLIKENQCKKSSFVLQTIKTLVNNNIPRKYEETATKSEKLIEKQIKISRCKCKKMIRERKSDIINLVEGVKLKKKRNMLLKCPGPEFLIYLKKVLYNGIIKAAYKMTRTEVINKFKSKRYLVLQKKFPPFFESPFGVSYFISKEIQDNLNNKIEETEKKMPKGETY